MSPRRLLVTGAAGFVGPHACAEFRARWPQAAIFAASRLLDAGDPIPGATFVPFDLRDPATITASVRRARPDACLHLAAASDVAGSFRDPDGVWAVNVDGTRALAGALRAHAPDCVLINAGSAEIYGLSFQSGAILDEHSAIAPANPYAAAKAAADLMLGEAALRGQRIIRFRALNHIGPGQSPRFVIANFARQIAAIERGAQPPVLKTGALHRARDFCDVRDIVRAYAEAIARAETLPNGAAFNLCSGVTRTIAAALDDLLRLTSAAIQVETEPAALRPLDIAATRCSAHAAQAALGWTPSLPWERSLADTLAWWRSAAPG